MRDIEEIVVTVRRKEESLQDVPLSVDAVSGETLEKLNLFQFEDLGKVVPGLTLTTAGNSATIRGVSFSPITQTNPTVSFYMNDAPLQSTFVFQSMFDVGQVEVLRGPQGTMRGQSAPSGAIMIATRKPDLYSVGGSMNATATDLDAYNFQGAFNMPLINEKLAFRVAGLADRNDNGGVESVNSSTDPQKDTHAYRASLRFDPIDTLSAVIAYQNLETKTVGFPGSSIYGTGAPGGTIVNPRSGYAQPYVQVANVNGPAIPKGKLRSVAENADETRAEQQFASAQIDYAFAGQKLSYVGAWSHNENPGAKTFADSANMVRGDWPGRATITDLTRWTHELRLSSEESLFGFLDYVVGAFDSDEEIVNNVNNGTSFQIGAFGSPLAAPIAQSPDLRYSTATIARIPSKTQERSYFGNMTFQLGKKTELSAGVRFIDAEKVSNRVNSQTAGVAAQVISPTACAAAGGSFGATYAGVCDVPVAARITNTVPSGYEENPVVYNASLSYHFTPTLMTYVSGGTAWRPAPPQGGLINGRNDPVLNSLIFLDDEDSRSYELGLKSMWLDQRLRVNVAYFHQNFEGLVTQLPGVVPYLSDTVVAPPTVAQNIGTVVNVDAEVDGIDLDASYAVTNNFDISGGVSWAKGQYSDELLPCQDGNFDGTPDTIFPTVAAFQSRGIFIAQCQLSSTSVSSTPRWNGNLRSEYRHSITSNVEGFISGLLTYYPENRFASPTYTVPSYELLNVYLGARSPESGWEVQLFAKNITDNDTITTLGTTDLTLGSTANSLFGNSGYSSIGYVPRREFGVTVRYSFGSR